MNGQWIIWLMVGISWGCIGVAIGFWVKYIVKNDEATTPASNDYIWTTRIYPATEPEEYTELSKHIKDLESDICAMENANRELRMALDNHVMSERATEVCNICHKRDFFENLADVAWMGNSCYSDVNIFKQYAHPECAGIVRSDDGKGWQRKAKAKK